MDVEEHFYSDDPAIGHADVRTTLENVDYFFLGNGLITAVIQVCRSAQGTPAGVLLMHPEVFGSKREALSLDPNDGLMNTMVRVIHDDHMFQARPEQLEASWQHLEDVPAVCVKWLDHFVEVREIFYCPDRSTARLVRQIHIRNNSNRTRNLRVKTGVLDTTREKSIEVESSGEEMVTVEYQLRRETETWVAEMSWTPEAEVAAEASAYWQNVASFDCDSDLLNHHFECAMNQLSANISQAGVVDASIWQYNLEWVRDQSMILNGLILSGQFELAHNMLERILTRFVTEQGDTVDSGKIRETAEVELDQNGALLHTLLTYVNWSGDLDLIREHWPKIRAAANFPLRKEFSHPDTPLLHNRREFWERHSLHGIEDGFELIYQVYVALGLAAAATMARLLGHDGEAAEWSRASGRISEAVISDSRFGFIEKGRLIKRRDLDGHMVQGITATAGVEFPEGIPLTESGEHFLNPDSSTALAVALEFVSPTSALATNTLEHLESLWNQRWRIGGYGRYHVSSEPDSPGPWPFASLFIARAYFEMKRDDKVWRVLNWLQTLPGGSSGGWFEFYGPRPVPPYPQIGIVPWTWAEVITLMIHHMLGFRPGWQKLHLKPRLLTGLNHLQAELRFRNVWIDVKIERAASSDTSECWRDGKQIPIDKNGVHFPVPDKDTEIFIRQGS